MTAARALLCCIKPVKDNETRQHRVYALVRPCIESFGSLLTGGSTTAATMLSREFAQPEANLYSSVALISTQHPSAYCHSLQSSTALVKRLKPVQTYKGHSSCVNALDWSPGGDLLVSGGEDCRIKIWSTERANEVTSFDSVWRGNMADIPCSVMSNLLYMCRNPCRVIHQVYTLQSLCQTALMNR